VNITQHTAVFERMHEKSNSPEYAPAFTKQLAIFIVNMEKYKERFWHGKENVKNEKRKE